MAARARSRKKAIGLVVSAGLVAPGLLGGLFGGMSSAQETAGSGSATTSPASAAPAPSTPPPATAAGDTPAPPAPQRPSRPAPPKRARPAAPVSNVPVATLPGFEMLADGASHLFVELTQTVQVQEKRAGNRIIYFLKQARVHHRNNENSLVTVFFNTPVDRAQLLPAPGGLNFVVDLRSSVTPTWQITAGKDNSAIFDVTFPKGDYLKNGGGAGGADLSSDASGNTPYGDGSQADSTSAAPSPSASSQRGHHRRQTPSQ
jgi:hypothetical protein